MMQSILTMLFAIMIITAFCSISIFYYKKVCNPVFIGNIVMEVAIVLAVWKNTMEDQMLSRAIFWVTIGLALFDFFFLFSQYIVNRGKNRCRCEYNIVAVNKLTKFCCILVVCKVALGLYEVLSVAPDFMSIFTNSTYVRHLYLHRSGSTIISLLSIFLSLNFYTTLCMLPVAVINKLPFAKIKIVFVMVMDLFSSIVGMSKDHFIVTCIIVFSSYMLNLKNVRSVRQEMSLILKKSKWIVVAFIVLLIVISFQRNYVGHQYESYVDAIIGTIKEYISIPLYSFGALIDKDNMQFFYGRQCFRPIFNILSYLGIGVSTSIMQEAIPGYANVYTAFGNMYNDFGLFGIVFLSVIFGFLIGCIYRKNCSNRMGRVVANSIINMTMVFLFFDFKFIQTIYVFSMLYAVLFEKFISRWLYKELKNEYVSRENICRV